MHISMLCYSIRSLFFFLYARSNCTILPKESCKCRCIHSLFNDACIIGDIWDLNEDYMQYAVCLIRNWKCIFFLAHSIITKKAGISEVPTWLRGTIVKDSKMYLTLTRDTKSSGIVVLQRVKHLTHDKLYILYYLHKNKFLMVPAYSGPMQTYIRKEQNPQPAFNWRFFSSDIVGTCWLYFLYSEVILIHCRLLYVK